MSVNVYKKYSFGVDLNSDVRVEALSTLACSVQPPAQKYIINRIYLHVKVIAVQVIVVVIIVVIVIIVVVDVYLRTLSMQVVGEKTLSTVVVSAPVWKCFEKSTNSPH